MLTFLTAFPLVFLFVFQSSGDWAGWQSQQPVGELLQPSTRRADELFSIRISSFTICFISNCYVVGNVIPDCSHSSITNRKQQPNLINHGRNRVQPDNHFRVECLRCIQSDKSQNRPKLNRDVVHDKKRPFLPSTAIMTCFFPVSSS